MFASKEVIEYVCNIDPLGSDILELGSGHSTEVFVKKGFKVTCIEHDLQYVNVVDHAQYIYAPIELYDSNYKLPRSISKRITTHSGWYNREAIKINLRHAYNIIFIDGPPRNFGRSGFLANLDLFDLNLVTIVFDDMLRIDDLYIAERVAHKLKRTLTIHNEGEKPFGVIL